MCVSPKFIRVERAGQGRSDALGRRIFAYENGVHPNIAPDNEDAFRFKHAYLTQVPCNQCPECLRKKQNDFAYRCRIEADKYASMALVTLTYKDEKLPFFGTLLVTSKETGEVYADRSNFRLSVSDLFLFDIGYKDLVNEFKAFPKSRTPFSKIVDLTKPKALAREFFNLDTAHYEYQLLITPSIDRKEVRDYLKRERERYFRAHNERLPKFSYYAVGEYGSKTCRPHYHLIICGLNASQLAELFSEWDKTIGHVDTRVVNAINQDGSDGFMKAAYYVGKYVSKGFFDNVMCFEGFAQKGRLFGSKDFGVPSGIKYSSDTRNMHASSTMQYFRADDLGQCDDMDLPIKLASDPAAFRHYADEVRKRSVFHVNGYTLQLPNIVKRRLFYVKKKDSEGKVHYLSTMLQCALAALARGSDIEIRAAQQEQPNRFEIWSCNPSDADLAQLRAAASSTREQAALERFIDRYANDRF